MLHENIENFYVATNLKWGVLRISLKFHSFICVEFLCKRRMSAGCDERDERDLPSLSYSEVMQGLGWRSEEASRASSMLDCMERTILYALTGWDCYMKGVSGLEVTNPENTSPKGVIMRFVSFISNPGAYVSQVELIRSPDGHYKFWVFGAKIAGGVPHEYKDTDYNLADFIYLLLRIVSPWNSIDKKLVSQHMGQFQADTGVRDFRPDKWTPLCAVLHHGLMLSSDQSRTNIQGLGWRISYQDGDHLIVYHDDYKVCEYYCAVRGAIGEYFQGKKHQRSCKTAPCILCWGSVVRNALYIVPTEVQTLILNYAK